MSSENSIPSGVIQGSVLGPLFFSIFVNDIDDVIKSCSILKYADDIRIYRHFEPNTSSQMISKELFQNDLNAIVEWSNK